MRKKSSFGGGMTFFLKIKFWFVLGIMNVFWLSARQASAIEFTKNHENIDFSLLTIGRGDAIYALYGHTILRIVDSDTGLDVGLNWGIFDFHNHLFVWNFYRGKLRYQMAMLQTKELLDHYRFNEKRAVIEEKIRLSPQQKAKLLERIQWNLLPENIYYDYEQFKDNCSTRPRDHLDFALHGAIKNRFSNMKTSEKFRDAIRKGAILVPWVYLGLDQFTNDLLDRTMTVWEKMFIPSALRESLLQMPAIDDGGQPIEDQNLLYATKILVDLDEPQPKSDPYSIFALLTLIPTSILGAVAIRFRGKLGLFSLKTLWGFWGFYSGMMGLLLLINFVVSGYPQLKNWVSLLILNPLDFYFLGLAIGFFRKNRRWFFKVYIFFRFSMVFFAAYVWISGVSMQNIVGTLSTAGVLAVWIFMISFLEGTHEGKSQA